ncbi:MAG: MFS transporter [Anaerolineae bacterium]|nr:MFS transporter [Anaerolineae bacterium]
MPHTFTRSRATWLIYLLLGFYAYCLNIFGPITPFLKNELDLTYTVSSFHFSAFALGMIAAGLIGHAVIQRIGRWWAAWVAVFGMSLSAGLLISGQTPILTISASFLMGLIGSLLLSVVPSVLADEHGAQTAKALSEANVIASLISSAAPVLVGWLAASSLGWRTALLLTLAAALILRLAFNGVQLASASVTEEVSHSKQRLPRRFWVYWLALMFGVSVEFCMIFWSADYFETILGMPKADAAQSVSLFLGGMIVGRFLASRLVQRFSVHQILTVSVLVAAVGFLLYWTATAPLVGMIGLALTGLGTAALYPLLLTLTIATVPGNTARASARASLASGVAIFALPLLLGRLADALGIHLAYGIILLLLIAVFAILQGSGRLAQSA